MKLFFVIIAFATVKYANGQNCIISLSNPLNQPIVFDIREGNIFI
jgi:hypothetical protein